VLTGKWLEILKIPLEYFPYTIFSLTHHLLDNLVIWIVKLMICLKFNSDKKEIKTGRFTCLFYVKTFILCGIEQALERYF